MNNYSLRMQRSRGQFISSKSKPEDGSAGTTTWNGTQNRGSVDRQSPAATACHHCGTTTKSTPMIRHGLDGPRTLCNACGLVWANKDGNEVFFWIKHSTQLCKLMNAYCDRQSVDFNSIAFLFYGRWLRREQTPDELEMDEGDEIDVMLHQTGGGLGY